jgi:hypothetical protein
MSLVELYFGKNAQTHIQTVFGFRINVTLKHRKFSYHDDGTETAFKYIYKAEWVSTPPGVSVWILGPETDYHEMEINLFTFSGKNLECISTHELLVPHASLFIIYDYHPLIPGYED